MTRRLREENGMNWENGLSIQPNTIYFFTQTLKSLFGAVAVYETMKAFVKFMVYKLCKLEQTMNHF